jgi:hypothetical protein
MNKRREVIRDLARRRGTEDIAAAFETADPGSNPARL